MIGYLRANAHKQQISVLYFEFEMQQPQTNRRRWIQSTKLSHKTASTYSKF